jgi:hypothetical protein
MNWIIEGVSFEQRERTLMIRDHAAVSSLSWLVSFALFGVVAVVGEAYVFEAIRGAASEGLFGWGKTGLREDAEMVGGLLLLLAVVGSVALAWARPVFGGHEILSISGETITLTNIDFGVSWRKREFRRSDVSDIEYAAVASTDMSSIYAIRFRAGKRAVTLFRYIKPDAAAEVVEALQNYQVRIG